MYIKMVLRFLVLFVCVIVPVSWSYEDSADGLAGYFQYSIQNTIQEPYFKARMNLKICESVPFIRYMEDSVMINPAQFTGFTSNFTSPYGYLIDSINNVAGNWAVNKTYWQISNASGPLTVGVSSYIPVSGDKILFKLVKGCSRSRREELHHNGM